MTWNNRIVGHGEEAPDQLLANPRNWRIHPKAQQEALEGLLGEVGWVQDVIVNRRTGHVVDGHLRVALAISRDEPVVPVVYVDLDEGEERLVLAALDPLAAMAITDSDQLFDLLQGRQTSGPIENLLSALAEEADASRLKDESRATMGAGRELTVKAVFAVPEIALVERAIRAVGVGSRGAALVEICRSYLSEKGQLDVEEEGLAALAGAQRAGLSTSGTRDSRRSR